MGLLQVTRIPLCFKQRIYLFYLASVLSDSSTLFDSFALMFHILNFKQASFPYNSALACVCHLSSASASVSQIKQCLRLPIRTITVLCSPAVLGGSKRKKSWVSFTICYFGMNCVSGHISGWSTKQIDEWSRGSFRQFQLSCHRPLIKVLSVVKRVGMTAGLLVNTLQRDMTMQAWLEAARLGSHPQGSLFKATETYSLHFCHREDLIKNLTHR